MPAKLIALYVVAIVGITCAAIASTTETQVKVLLAIPVAISTVFLAYIIARWRK